MAMLTAMIAASSACPPRTAFKNDGFFINESTHWFCNGARDGDLLVLVRDKRVLFMM